ncbi:hypothetical protein SFC43_16115 [Bacteroides sp. CR5/BHMF/2]|nr:hypothetical protein [Bacteroides sp. CR5/BHMF/2]
MGAISPWKATVESGDFVVLSSTPSFDPRVGMDDPGIQNTIRCSLMHIKGREEPMWKVGDVSISVLV